MKTIMPKPIAKWLLNNTTLTRGQIARFTGLSEKDVMLMEHGLSDEHLRALDPRIDGQLSQEEIERGEADPGYEIQNHMQELIHKYIINRAEKNYVPMEAKSKKHILGAWIVKNLPNYDEVCLSNFFGISKNLIHRAKKGEFDNMILHSPVELNFCTEEALISFKESPNNWKKVEKTKTRSKTF